MEMETTTPRQTSGPPGHAGSPQTARDAALRRLGRLKAAVTVASVLGFAALSGVIARQAAGATSVPSSSTGPATQGVPSAPSDTGTGNGQALAPADQGTGTQGQQGSQGQNPTQGTQGPQGGFFSQGQGGYGFGNGNSAQGQGPVAGSGVS